MRMILAVWLAACSATAVHALPAPDAPGDFLVGHTEDTIVDAARANRTLPLHIWYPADATSWSSEVDFSFFPLFLTIGITSTTSKDDVVVDSGSFPLIIFSHGFGGTPTQSLQLMEHLASHGFVVVSISHTGNIAGDLSSPDPEADRYPDVAFTIDEVGLMNTDAGNLFFGHVDNQNTGVAGHSFGGMTAEFMAAGHSGSPADPRVKAIMPIAASSSALSDPELAGITLPSLLMCGTLDGLLSEQIRGFGLISSAPDLFRVDVVGATHTHFANICDLGNALIDGGFPKASWPSIGAGALVAPYEATCEPPAFDIGEAIRIQNLYAAAHFRAYLNAETEYYDYLTTSFAEANEPDVIFFGSGSLVPEVPELAFLSRCLLVGGFLAAGRLVLRSGRSGASVPRG
jgi:predicted dienelactone hydrolase